MDAYTAKAVKYQLIDQQVRSVDIGKAQVCIGIVTRGKLLLCPNKISGEATLLSGPDLVNPSRDQMTRTVRLQNGPGYNTDGIRQPLLTHLKPGNMIIIPAGTGHLFTIPDHITYMMVRIHPDKLVPTKSDDLSDRCRRITTSRSEVSA